MWKFKEIGQFAGVQRGYAVLDNMLHDLITSPTPSCSFFVVEVYMHYVLLGFHGSLDFL